MFVKKGKNWIALWTRIKNWIPVVHGILPLQETRVLTVHWNKCQDDTYWPLERLNLENVRAEGVYVIWHGGTLPRTVRVGQGIVAERLRAHRFDSEVLAYKNGGLYVTWAAVSDAQRDGVEKYLADLLHPRVGDDAFPEVLPIAVNSPWG
jgi:hypothetical protein